MSEWHVQAEFIKLFRILFPDRMAFHVPNAHAYSVKNRFYMSKIGLLAGVPDIFIPESSSFGITSTQGISNTPADCKYNGLFIEFKSKSGTLSGNQQSVIALLAEKGYPTFVTRSTHIAILACSLYFHAPQRLFPTFLVP